MKYLTAVVTLCALVFPCSTSIEIHLQPTPLAFDPFGNRYEHQVRDQCPANCASLDATIQSAKDVLDSASRIYYAATRIKELVSSSCSGLLTSGTTTGTVVAIETVVTRTLVCPTISTLCPRLSV